ncbi:MAG: protein adenylyltransferase SelO [Pseudanabaenaceae cyanobacterium]
MVNPFFQLAYEPAFASLGEEFYDRVLAAQFPMHKLRWRNDDLLPKLGLDPQQVKDEDFIEAFGQFADAQRQFLAMRYHGYQFGVYNPQLGDGRGFLYGQVRGTDGELYDFGTKGSGQTPYSRGGDGRLTLKGGVREVLAAEALHRMGVNTSRCLSLIETGEQLWRGDEPSPTRSSVMVRFSKSHIRFGTFERLHYYQRPDLIRKLLDHVIDIYYPHLHNISDDPEVRDVLFFGELVARTAKLCAQWMAAGFCHAVLNTDNMSITGESFDYGPYAFIPTYDLRFTAAYFDYYGRYCYINQPSACYWNLERLQDPLSWVIPIEKLQAQLETFGEILRKEYLCLMYKRLGLVAHNGDPQLLQSLLNFLLISQVDYNGFFARLRQDFTPQWRDDPHLILADLPLPEAENTYLALQNFRQLYHQALLNLSPAELAQVPELLQLANPLVYLLRPRIEEVWSAIDQEDHWQPFYDLVGALQTS